MNYKHNEEFCKAFGAHIRKLRLANDLSMRELADLCEVDLSQIRRIESGEINTSISTVLALAEALRISHKEIFNFTFPAREKK